MYVHVQSSIEKVANEQTKKCGTGSDNTTLCILFTLVSTYKVPSTTLLYIMHLN